MHVNWNVLVAIPDKFVFCNIRMKGISHSERDGFMSWMTPIRLGMRQNAFHHLWWLTLMGMDAKKFWWPHTMLRSRFKLVYSVEGALSTCPCVHLEVRLYLSIQTCISMHLFSLFIYINFICVCTCARLCVCTHTYKHGHVCWSVCECILTYVFTPLHVCVCVCNVWRLHTCQDSKSNIGFP